MDLVRHLVGLAVSGGRVLLVIVDDIIQGVLELIETRKHGHGGIERDVAERSRGGLSIVEWSATSTIRDRHRLE